jgi:uracil phosphoribosyltransferase
MASNVIVIDHPLVLHKLTHLRQKERSTNSFRSLLAEISILLAYEVTRDLPLVYETIETPFATMRAPVIEGKKVVLINILRAGTGMTEGMLQILPSARVGHIGVYRDPETLGAVEYYFKVPREMADRDVIVVDPMLATGNSAIAAVSPRRRESRTSTRRTRTSRSTPPPSMSASTNAATSCPEWATPAIAFSAPSEGSPFHSASRVPRDSGSGCALRPTRRASSVSTRRRAIERDRSPTSRW